MRNVLYNDEITKLFLQSEQGSFCYNIGHLLVDNDINFTEFARYIGINKQTFYNWNSGKPNCEPQWTEYIYKINKFFAERLDYFNPLMLFIYKDINFEEARQKDVELRQKLDNYSNNLGIDEIADKIAKLEKYEDVFKRLQKYGVNIDNVEYTIQNSITKPVKQNKKQLDDLDDIIKTIPQNFELRLALKHLREKYIDVKRKYGRNAKYNYKNAEKWVILKLISILSQDTPFTVNAVLYANKLSDTLDIPKIELENK